MRGRTYALCVAATMFLAGCHSYKLTPVSDVETTSKPSDCSFRLVRSWRQPGYVPVATFRLADGRRPATSHNQFWHDIRSQVCEVGGDVVVAQVNVFGWIVGGVVLRYEGSGRPPRGPLVPSSQIRRPSAQRYER